VTPGPKYTTKTVHYDARSVVYGHCRGDVTYIACPRRTRNWEKQYHGRWGAVTACGSGSRSRRACAAKQAYVSFIICLCPCVCSSKHFSLWTINLYPHVPRALTISSSAFCTYGLRMILTANRHWSEDLCNGEVWRSLCGTDLIL
jgi:hypothetical protein